MHFTLDSHHTVDVGHPIFWKNSEGASPEPFTTITHEDVKAGNWLPYDSAFTQRMLDYTRLLEKNNRYQLTIWPIHCRIATWGNTLYPSVDQAVRDWEVSQLGVVDFVTKGLKYLYRTLQRGEGGCPRSRRPRHAAQYRPNPATETM